MAYASSSKITSLPDACLALWLHIEQHTNQVQLRSTATPEPTARRTFRVGDTGSSLLANANERGYSLRSVVVSAPTMSTRTTEMSLMEAGTG